MTSSERVRDFIRHVQNLRRNLNFNVNDQIIIEYNADEEITKSISKFSEYIKIETLATKIILMKNLDDIKTINLDGSILS
ncbi:MAG: hypothetical protein FK731_13865 [Asgard group archaeon]|nr:hypothetical protein [Asgard group archaeon]